MNHEPRDETMPETRGSPAENLEVGSSNPPHRTNLPATYTPHWLAEDMVALADIRTYHYVLEPSAGEGQLVKSLRRVHCESLLAVELNQVMADHIWAGLGVATIHGDFLKTSFARKFHRIVMNPPEPGDRHVHRASELLLPEGRLVALMHTDIARRVTCRLPGVRLYHLSSDTFIHAGKYLPASILVWDKPE